MIRNVEGQTYNPPKEGLMGSSGQTITFTEAVIDSVLIPANTFAQYDIVDIPTLNNITNAKITKIRNANFATKLFDSEKDGEPTFPLVVENDLNASLSLIIYK